MEDDCHRNMHLKRRAYYNLLILKTTHGQSLNVPPWALTCYRDSSIHDLFQKLDSLGFSLNEENFLLYAEGYDSPEALTDFLWTQDENKDWAYLIMFELWRRLIPEKPSLSILCDELDHQIEEYQQSRNTHVAPIHNLLLRLREILDENVDEGGDPKIVFQNIGLYFAHDLETFLYHFISDRIDIRELIDATELIECFSPYLIETSWLDFLKARIVSLNDSHEGNLLFKKILETTRKSPDLDLLLELGHFLVHHGDPHLFQETTKQAFNLLSSEEDFQELLEVSGDYYDSMDMKHEAKKTSSILLKRKDIAPSQTLNRQDTDLDAFASLLGKGLIT